MRRKLTTTIPALALGTVLLLAACGGGDTAEAGGTNDTSAASTVTMLDNEYEPAEPVIAAGEVELVNEDESPHTFTIEGEDVDVEVEAGQSATARVDVEPGTYTLFCDFHRSQGMETTLTVE
jgi:plastocyanin